MYPVFTHMPGGATVGESGLCCRVPCLQSAINFLCLFKPPLCVALGVVNASSCEDQQSKTGYPASCQTIDASSRVKCLQNAIRIANMFYCVTPNQT